jgi:Heterokaryon incompatibility protein (HET)
MTTAKPKDLPRMVALAQVDRICINQDDKKEKGHQVGMMSKVYKGAKKVLIWLGEETSHTKGAIGFVQEVAESHGYKMLHNHVDEHWWRGPLLKGLV